MSEWILNKSSELQKVKYMSVIMKCSYSGVRVMSLVLNSVTICGYFEKKIVRVIYSCTHLIILELKRNLN